MTLTALEFTTTTAKVNVQAMLSALVKVSDLCEGLPDGESTFNRWRSMIDQLPKVLSALTEFLEQHHDGLLASVNALLNQADVVSFAEQHCRKIPY